MTLILHSKPWSTAADVQAVERVLQSGMLAQGEKTREFEHALSEWVGGAGGVAVGSGSAALVLALRALGVGRGDDVVLPTYVCASVAEAVVTVGATPVLCDVGPCWVVTEQDVAARLTRRTRALIVPHMYGVFADVASFRRFSVPIIEDCAQAVDERAKRRVAGDIAIFSFHPTKCLTTGEGGMAVSADPDLVDAMRAIRDAGESACQARLFSPLSDVSAALGLSQLARYHQALERRRLLALRYRQALESVAPESLERDALANSMFFRFPVKVKGGVDAHGPGFAGRGVTVRRGVDQLLHRLRGESDDDFKTSVTLFDTTLSLPIYPALSDDEHARCMRAAVEILSAAERAR